MEGRPFLDVFYSPCRSDVGGQPPSPSVRLHPLPADTVLLHLVLKGDGMRMLLNCTSWSPNSGPRGRNVSPYSRNLHNQELNPAPSWRSADLRRVLQEGHWQDSAIFKHHTLVRHVTSDVSHVTIYHAHGITQTSKSRVLLSRGSQNLCST
jgi:hypothetical protein